MSNLEQKIYDLENELQQHEVRKSTERLAELISDDFLEFGSAGLSYTKKDVLTNLPTAGEIKFKMMDFRINVLSEGIVQSLFKTEKVNLENGKTSYSLRSSIWRKEGDKWVMIFHQGTPEAK